MDLRLTHPANIVASGPSASGKSYFVEKLILGGTKYFKTDFKDIVWCYADYYPTNRELRSKVKFQKGLEGLERQDFSNPRLIVIDDQMLQSLTPIVEYFTRGTHHTNCSVIYISQNLFHQGKGARDLSLNTHYLVLFKNPRDQSQVRFLARQICPSNPKALSQAYIDAVKRPHGYLLLDLRQETPEDFRWRTDILGEVREGCETVYQPRYKKV
jgi:hypothetical protein